MFLVSVVAAAVPVAMGTARATGSSRAVTVSCVGGTLHHESSHPTLGVLHENKIQI